MTILRKILAGFVFYASLIGCSTQDMSRGDGVEQHNNIHTFNDSDALQLWLSETDRSVPPSLSEMVCLNFCVIKVNRPYIYSPSYSREFVATMKIVGDAPLWWPYGDIVALKYRPEVDDFYHIRKGSTMKIYFTKGGGFYAAKLEGSK